MDTFSSLFEEIFGVYSPVQYTDALGNIAYSPDFGYISKVAVFIVFMYCVLRIIGMLFDGGRRR